MIILFFADIFGKPGRKAVSQALPTLQSQYQPDFIIGNVENLAGGRGVNQRSLHEMFELGFSCFTSGNHIWDNKEVYPILRSERRVLRPENYPSARGAPCPGSGSGVFASGKHRLRVINLMGRLFMDSVDCPFRAVDTILSSSQESMATLVDMHADATSEKNAMGWFLAGRVSAVVGSHSHVQTADERILPGGTAYITDVGMSGSFDSVIGFKPEKVIEKFMTKRPARAEMADSNLGVSAVVIKLDDLHRAISIERIRVELGLNCELSDGEKM